ncbi:MAG: succinate dehydrogenase [Paracoccaceae bacterium]
MRARLALAAVCLVALAGCEATDQAMQDTSRVLAKRVVNEAVVRQFPGARPEPYSDCIIDNASMGEITRLAGDAVTGVDAQTLDLVVDIAARPDVTLCLLRAGLPAAV